jgi:hypothetical protein
MCWFKKRSESRTLKEIELQEFVRDTLVQIIHGVDQAKKEIKDTTNNAEIAPVGLSFTHGQESRTFKSGKGFVHEVEFDVAITKSETKDKKAELSVISGIVGAGFNFGKGGQSHSLSRIKFSVPILFPSESEQK